MESLSAPCWPWIFKTKETLRITTSWKLQQEWQCSKMFRPARRRKATPKLFLPSWFFLATRAVYKCHDAAHSADSTRPPESPPKPSISFHKVQTYVRSIKKRIECECGVDKRSTMHITLQTLRASLLVMWTLISTSSRKSEFREKNTFAKLSRR